MGVMSDFQLRLLQHSCGLPLAEEVGPPTGEHPDLLRAARLITQGAFLEAVQTVPAVRALLDCSGESDAVHDADTYYSLISHRASTAMCGALATAGTDAAEGGAAGPSLELGAVLLAGVASLHIFGQYNLTGPSYCGPPPSPLDLFAPPPTAKHFAEPPPRPPPGAAAAAIAAVIGDSGPAAAAAAAVSVEVAAAASETTAASGDSPAADPAAASKPDGLCGLGVDSLSLGDRWAQEQLQLDGEDVMGRCPAVQWLLLARRLLVKPLGLGPLSEQKQKRPQQAAVEGAGSEAAAAGSQLLLPSLAAPSWPWWALRCVMSHQHALDGRAHSLLSEASQLIQALVAPGAPWAAQPAAEAAPAPPSASSAPGPPLGLSGREAAALSGVLHVELALCQYAYGYVDAGRQYLVRAGQLLGLEPQLTGAMGKRTVHQVDAKAQLVVAVSESLRSAPPLPDSDEPVESLGLGGGGGQPSNRELEGMVDESEVFPAPVLVGVDGALLETRYSSPEQALLLAWATAVKKGTSADDLQDWQMAPWVEAVLAQRRGVFMTAAAARLCKTRHERSRGRTRERALLQMDQLAEAVAGVPPPPPASDAAVAETEEYDVAAGGRSGDVEVSTSTSSAEAGAGRRAVLSWAVWFPLQVSLRREAAEHYVSMGLVGSAIRVFESLELWDSALTCYRLLGKKALAEELIRRRLAVTPEDPRLWCALGDLHMDDKYYEEAWRRSGQRHTRSQRSLARSAMGRKDYAKAAVHWDAALSLNPLHPEAWFALGFCHLRAERHREALRAFTRVTQQEPDNGEAWNNIAALWMHLGGYRPAFAALSESVRHKRDSWQAWENYARAALASGNYQPAVRGLQMALQLSSGQRLFVDVVSGLLDVLEGRQPPRDGGTSLAAAAVAAADGLLGVAGAVEPAAVEEDSSLQEFEAALGVPLLPLLSDVPLRPPGEPLAGPEGGADDAAATAAPEAAAGGWGNQQQQDEQYEQAAGGTAAPELVSGREREMVLGGLGSLLREGVNSPASGPALWGCLARYWALKGEMESAKEARLKQVRGLAVGAFKSDPARFAEYAEASEALARSYLACHKLGRQGGIKDLAAGRMHLRGLLRATAENFGEHPLTAKLQGLLEEITQLEDVALAASRAVNS